MSLDFSKEVVQLCLDVELPMLAHNHNHFKTYLLKTCELNFISFKRVRHLGLVPHRLSESQRGVFTNSLKWSVPPNRDVARGTITHGLEIRNFLINGQRIESGYFYVCNDLIVDMVLGWPFFVEYHPQIILPQGSTNSTQAIITITRTGRNHFLTANAINRPFYCPVLVVPGQEYHTMLFKDT